MGWNEVVATGFTIFTIILLVCAVMDHHWILVETKMQNYFSGIWKVCIKQVCSDLIAASPNVYGARTLLILALFCGIVGASFMTFTYRYSSPFTIYRYLVAAMGSLIAAALVFLALSIYTIRISTHSISRTGKITYLWSFYMAWASCPCFILSGLFSLMAHQRLLVHGSGLSDGESSTLTLSSSGGWTSSSTSYLDDSEGERRMSLSARRTSYK